jgi:hypothetical protein
MLLHGVRSGCGARCEASHWYVETAIQLQNLGRELCDDIMKLRHGGVCAIGLDYALCRRTAASDLRLSTYQASLVLSLTLIRPSRSIYHIPTSLILRETELLVCLTVTIFTRRHADHDTGASLVRIFFGNGNIKIY